MNNEKSLLCPLTMSPYSHLLCHHLLTFCAAMRLSTGDFTVTDVTATNVTFNWNSTALIAKGVKQLHFAALPYETTDPPVNVSSSVKPGKVTTRLLTPYTAYRLSVREDSTKGPAIQLGTIKTWPTGIEHFFIFLLSL